TATPDLTSEFPALAARKLGFADVPLMCASEIAVPHGLPRVVRLMAHVDTDRPRAELHHVYLRGAQALRLDIAQCPGRPGPAPRTERARLRPRRPPPLPAGAAAVSGPGRVPGGAGRPYAVPFPPGLPPSQ